MAYNAGSAWLQILPSFDGVVTAIAAQAEKWGKETGTIFKKSFESRVQDLKISVDSVLNSASVAETSAKLDAETKDRTVHIKTEVDGGGLGLLSAVLGGAGLGGLGGLLGKAPGGALGGLAIGGGVFALLGALPAVIGLIGGVATAFGAAALAAGAFGAVAFTAVTAALAGGAGMDPWLKHLRAQLLAGESAFGAFFDRVTQMEMPVISKIVGQVIGVGIKILPTFLPLIAAGGVGMEAFTKNLMPAFTNPAFGQFTSQMAKVAPAVLGGAGKALASLGEGFANLAQAFIPLVPLVTKGFVGMTEAFKKWAMSLVSSKGFANFIADAKKTLPEVAKLFGDVAAGVFSVVGFLATLSVTTGSALGAVVKWVGTVVKSIIGWYGHMTGLNQFVSRALSSIAAGFGKLAGFISQIIAGLGRWLHTHWAQITDDASIAWNIVSSAIRIAWEVITSIIHGAAVLLVPALALVWSLIFNGVSIAWTIITTAIGTAITLIIWTIERIGDVVGFFQKLPGRIVGAIGVAWNILLQVGKDIVGGLLSGIQNAWHKVTSWIGNAISGLTSVAKKVLGISSPSTVFYGIGQNIGEGLAAGLLASTNKVNAASRGMLSGLTGPGNLGLVSNSAIMASVGVSGAVSVAGMGNNAVLAALQRIEAAIHVEGAAPTGAAISTKVSATMVNAIQQQQRTALQIARAGG